MDSEIYNKKTLTDYLLGKLPKVDAEIYDELSITDDSFAQDLHIAENELIDSYLHNELADDDQKRFEANYLASPLRRKKVDFARTLQVVAEKNFVKPSDDDKKSWADIFAFWKLNSALRYGFAALLLTLVGFFGWFLLSKNKVDDVVKVQPTPTQQPTQQPTISPIQKPSEIVPIATVSPKKTSVDKTPESHVSPTLTPTQKPTPEPTKTQNVPTLATFVLLPPTRNVGNLQTISFPQNTTNVAFRLPLESDDFKSYALKLANQSGKVLWHSSNLKSKKTALNVQLNAKLLQNNIYSFELTGIDTENNQQNIGNYSFKVVIK